MINGFNWKVMLGAFVCIGALAWYTAPAKTQEVDAEITTCVENKAAKAYIESNRGNELLVVEGQSDLDVFHEVLFGKKFSNIATVRVYSFKGTVRIIGFASDDCITGWVDIYTKQWEGYKTKFKEALRGV